jgi:hypothetical protein
MMHFTIYITFCAPNTNRKPFYRLECKRRPKEEPKGKENRINWPLGRGIELNGTAREGDGRMACLLDLVSHGMD